MAVATTMVLRAVMRGRTKGTPRVGHAHGRSGPLVGLS